jgi:carbonic anhydrase
MSHPKTGRRFLFAALLAALALTGAACSTPKGSAESWGYHGDVGPDDWAFLNPDYRVCCRGKRQSPIDIVQPRRAALPPLTFDYAVLPRLTARFNGHTINAEVTKGGALRIGGETFALAGFHFHRRSEHLLGGRDFPMEMHLVHAAGAERAVVGIFLIEGAGNPELAKIWKNLPDKGHPSTTVEDFDLAALLPDDRSSFRYPGSLTTPTCDENVRWIVLAEPITLTAKQISDFEKVFSGKEFPEGNRRPAQALRGRVVETDVTDPSLTDGN